jgi:hypothetical protein
VRPGSGEKDGDLAQKLGQLQPFIAAILHSRRFLGIICLDSKCAGMTRGQVCRHDLQGQRIPGRARRRQKLQIPGGKSKKKDRNLEDSSRGQADPGSAVVYTMDRPGPVICMYVCVGTVYRALGPTDPLVVA